MRRRILIVDDEPDMRLLLRLSLRGGAYDVEEAATGEEALEAVGSSPFDLVLLDLNLPGLGGMDLLERWDGAAPPVVVLTADTRPGLEEKALGLGAASYLTKPVAPTDLVAHIEGVFADGAPAATVEGP